MLLQLLLVLVPCLPVRGQIWDDLQAEKTSPSWPVQSGLDGPIRKVGAHEGRQPCGYRLVKLSEPRICDLPGSLIYQTMVASYLLCSNPSKICESTV